jgi:3-carboxy-cis,cis-muconate cycloisomerase
VLFGLAAWEPGVGEATSDAGWLRAMLRVEAALARAAAEAGLVPAEAADAVAAACDARRFDLASLAEGFATEATPVIALVRRLRELVPAEAARAVHVAATSQDVLDTAMMLVARDAAGAVAAQAWAVADLLAGLAVRHRDTPQAGRTLGQHAVPATFGAWCAARLVAIGEALDGLARVRAERLAVQLGGAAGTLAPAGERGPALVAALAERLGLAEPVVPWHTARGRVGELAAALGVLAGELGAVAQDVVLLSSSDVAELAPASPGGSSAMPHKRNPSRAVLAVACAHRVPGLAGTLLAGLPQELQRAAGRWQAEPAVLTELLQLTGATAWHTRAALDGVRVDTVRMRATVDALLAATGGTLELGSAGTFTDRALSAHASRRRHQASELRG